MSRTDGKQKSETRYIPRNVVRREPRFSLDASEHRRTFRQERLRKRLRSDSEGTWGSSGAAVKAGS